MCSDGGSSQSAGAEELYRTQAGISREQFAMWRENFLPLERQTIQDVAQLRDPAFVQQRVGEAQQGVSAQFSAARGAQERRMDAMGVNPSDGIYSSAHRELGLAEAGARAGVANQTRQDAFRTSLNAQGGLIGLGRNLSSQASAGLGGAASGLAGLGAQRQGQANAENAAMGTAVGAGIGAWGSAYAAGAVAFF